ncbi:uncharacterized protein LOC101852723 [Aplysia californica]|uniref:Glycosyltransferase family 92 protein n=1 Tax=Aplysia californica TaxID=6500 RepID=A0ABM0K3C0_APLCA|nr:uncharacterized protein LOC101852723 [Aplysia californica]
MTSSWAKLVSHTSNPRCLLPVLFALVFLYILIYLLWATPVSHATRRLHTKSVVSHTFKGSDLSPRTEWSMSGVDKIMPDGEGVWIDGRHIEVMSAIFNVHSAEDRPKVMLPSFLKHSVPRDFVCCIREYPGASKDHQTRAVLEHIDLRFIADYQSSTFSCLLPGDSGKIFDSSQPPKYELITFAPESCGANETNPMRIVYPVRRKFEFAVCTKVAYARLEPVHLVEWFEYMQEVGMSKVVTFHNSLQHDTRRVFDHYVSTGLLELIEYYPRSKSVVFTEANGQSRQARHDKTLTVTDCQYRLGGYDFVLTIDFDELPVPQRPYGTINWVLQDFLRNNSDASAFRMTPILLPPDWRSDEVDLYHWTLHKGSYIGQYCIKWAYVPARTKQAATHEHLPKDPYKPYSLPQEMLHFLHFRECKRSWLDVQCASLKPSILNETSLARFNGRVRHRLQQIPLQGLVRDSSYVQMVQSPPRKGDKRKSA